MSSSATSFTKKARVKIGQIPGTKPSFYNNQLLISTGIPSLDAVIGGGLGVGTVLLLEEDFYGNYARLMMKYFAAEAVMTQQALLLSSVESQQLIKELPAPVEDSKAQLSVSSKEMDPPSDKMKIAWRYESKPKVGTQASSSSPVSFGHYFDLTKTMQEEKISQCDISHSTSPLEIEEVAYLSPIPRMNFRYCQLLQEIRNRVKSGGFSISQEGRRRNILRIGIHSLGSALWGEDSSTQNYDPSLALFLIALRALLRSSFAVAFITIPSHLFEQKSILRTRFEACYRGIHFSDKDNTVLIARHSFTPESSEDKSHFQRIESLCDTVVKLESFAGSDREKNPVFKEYHGLFHVVHLPRVNSLVPPQRDTADLAFKLRRKKLTIEKLHLPPELADSTGRSQDEDSPLFSKRSTSGCSTSTSKFDF